MPVEAKKDTRKVTPDPAGPPTVVEQLEKDRTVTGEVGVLDIADARINPAREDGILADIEAFLDTIDADTSNIPADPAREGGNLAGILTQLDITLSALRDALRGAATRDFSTIQTVLDSLATHARQDTIIGHIDGIEALLATIDADTSNIPADPAREGGNLAGIAALLATIDADTSQLRTVLDSIKDTDGIKKITDTVTIAPSGDMARKHPWDRNPTTVVEFYSAALAAHGLTTRWTYTVPANHTAIHSVLFEDSSTKIATAGKFTSSTHAANIAAGGDKKFAGTVHFSTTDHSAERTVTATFYLSANDVVVGRTYSNDTVAHGMTVASLLMEFDV